MRRVYLTYLDHLGKYGDRFRQICGALPGDVEGVVFTRNSAGVSGVPKHVRVVEFPGGLAFRSVFLQWQLLKTIRAHAGPRTRIVIQDWFKNFALALFFRKLLGAQVFFIYAPVISDYGWLYKRWRRIVPGCGLRYDWLRARGALLDWWMSRACDLLLVQSSLLVAFYREAYGLRNQDIDYNYNPDSGELQKLRIQNEPGAAVQIGFVGNFELHKGARELLELAKELPEGFRIRIAGQARGRANVALFEQIRKLPNVVVEGLLTREQLGRFFGEIDALVLFSYHEGSPRVVREFLPYNKPVFLYDNPGTDYCRDMAGVHNFAYGNFRAAFPDLKRLRPGTTVDRALPAVLFESRLEAILARGWSHD